MVALPKPSNTTESLIESRVHRGNRNAKVTYGTIGHACHRKLWYGFHWASPIKEIPEFLQRLFNVGLGFEDKIIADLTRIGVEVTREQEVIIGFAGHGKTKIDGVGIGIPEAPETKHLLEFKTANEKNFNKMKKHGCKSHPVYHAQVQMSMGKLGMTRCLFVVENKNTSKRYYERVHFDKVYFQELEKKEREIIMSDVAPFRFLEAKSFECMFCEHKDVCNGEAQTEKNCRTCVHVDIHKDGEWKCNRTDKVLTYSEQVLGCDVYKKGWGL